MVEGTRLESVRTFTRTAGSNPALSASKNLNRTLGLGSFLDSFPLLLLHITSSNRLYRLVAGCIDIWSIAYKRTVYAAKAA